MRSVEISQLLAMQGTVFRLSSICTSPLYNSLFIQIAFWLRENAGSSELRPSSRLMLKTVFLEEEMLEVQEQRWKIKNIAKKESNLFIWLKIGIKQAWDKAGVSLSGKVEVGILKIYTTRFFTSKVFEFFGCS